MKATNLNRRLNSIGKAAFVKHFQDFKAYSSGEITKQTCIDRIISAGTSNWDGANIRCSNAKSIFNVNMQKEALEHVAKAKRIPNYVRGKLLEKLVQMKDPDAVFL